MRGRESQSKRQGSINGTGGNATSYGHNQKYGGQEQSVERLKNCIADLKKLATSKVKKTTANNFNMNSNSNLNLANQNGRYESRHAPGYAGSRDGHRVQSHQ